ncbi:TRAP transporter substrate-binding protein DctP [Variovorax sp. UC122_21]|uniref:TRAP transporter substrate-binding protein DctP n=1 Tax=Variovorax sp. UC122_21 TaxID=3374554 RepID=UPI0037579E96
MTISTPRHRARGWLLALACAAFGAGVAPSHAQVLQLKWGHVYEASSIFHQQAELAARKIAEQSEGKIRIEVVPASRLGQEGDYPLMLANDSVQIAYVTAATLAEGYAPLRLGSYPFAFKDLDHVRKYLASPLLGQLMKGYDERSGNHLVASVYYGARQVTSNRPLARPEDFRDLRLHVPDASAYQLFATALDAKPVTLPYVGLYDALKKNEVEAQEYPLSTVKAKKLYEVQKYVQLTAHVYDTLGIVIGKAAWAKLSTPAAGDGREGAGRRRQMDQRGRDRGRTGRRAVPARQGHDGVAGQPAAFSRAHRAAFHARAARRAARRLGEAAGARQLILRFLLANRPRCCTLASGMRPDRIAGSTPWNSSWTRMSGSPSRC